jgi:hypothetical protein
MTKTVRRFSIALAGAAALTPFIVGAEHPNAKTATDTPAVITYTDPATDPVVKFYSDGAGPYVDQTQGVSAFFFASGNAGLDTESSTVRTLILDISSPVQAPAGGAPSLFANGSLMGDVTVNLSHQLLNSNGSCCQSGGLLGMPANSSGFSRIGLTFPDPQKRAYLWTIKWGTALTNSTYDCALPTSNTGGTSGYWTVGNISTTSGCTYAEIDYQSTKGKSNPAVYGYFDLPFQFVIAKK